MKIPQNGHPQKKTDLTTGPTKLRKNSNMTQQMGGKSLKASDERSKNYNQGAMPSVPAQIYHSVNCINKFEYNDVDKTRDYHI